jgi:Fe-S cluster biogenesis protein NfuA
MPSAPEDQAFRQRVQRVETLLQELEEVADTAVRDRVRELVQTLLDYHGAALGRLLDLLGEASEAGQSLVARLARDELVGSMFLLYGLHPLDFETRVRQALERVGPALRAHGGTVELASATEGMVRVRVGLNGHSCQSSAGTLRTAIEEAIYGAAPEVAAVEVEGLAAPAGPGTTFVSVEELLGTAAKRTGKVPVP